MTYARGTDVSVTRSQEEIGKTFSRYRIETYGFNVRPGQAAVQFVLAGVPVDIAIPLPARPTAVRVTSPDTGRSVLAMPRWEQEVKEVWRALVLLLKANLEAVERGLLSAEQAFLAYVAIGDGSGRVLGDVIIPQWREQRLAIEQ